MTSAFVRRGAIHTPLAKFPKPSQVSRVRSWWRCARSVSGTENTTSTQPSSMLAGERVVKMRRSPRSIIGIASGLNP